MTFNNGDKVRFKTASNTAWYGVEGVIEGKTGSGSNKVRLTKGATGWASHYGVGSEATLGDYDLELVEDKPLTLNGFTVGDKVRYVGPSHDWKGVEGIIEELSVAAYSNNHRVRLLTEPKNPRSYSMSVGALARLKPRDLELVEEVEVTPTAPKPGDKVVVDLDTDFSSWHKVEGIVIAKRGTYGTSYTVKVTKAGPNNKYVEIGKEYTLSNLTVIPPFTFADIEKGDTIRRTSTYKGATEVREGVVGSKGSYYWANEQGNYILAYDTDDRPSDVTLELVNRPEPEPEPTLLQTTKIGDQLLLELRTGVSKLYTKKGADSWGTLVFKHGVFSHAGFTWDSKTLEDQVESAKSHQLIKA